MSNHHSEAEGVSIHLGPAKPQALTYGVVLPAWGDLWVARPAWDTDAGKLVDFDLPDNIVQLIHDLRDEWAWTVAGHGRGIAVGVDFATYGRFWRPGPYEVVAPEGDGDS